ncbi:MAG: helix-turn-helix domain-containing protein [Candidatus Woesearchaeota archaeon]|nr:helix-turn-helix domain-containing protein [Candidatus Woesearchaeota archaeon]
MHHIDLEKVIKEKIEPKVEHSLHQILGVTIGELSRDITAKLGKNPFFDFHIDTKIKFKDAKKRFKEAYLRKLLLITYGNVSEVARIAAVDRRSVHRLAKKGKIDIDQIRTDMVKAYEVKQSAVTSMIEDVLDSYKSVLHPAKLERAYHSVSGLSKEIVDNLPDEPLPLKDAEEVFEAEYLQKALDENGHRMAQTAKKIGIRSETLFRKCKKLALVA